MKRVWAVPGKELVLGRAGENGVTEAVFPLSGLTEDLPEAVTQLRHTRAGDPAPYPAVTYEEEGCLVWPITNADTARPGQGSCELVILEGELIRKSRSYPTRVLPAAGGCDPVPEPWVSWVDQVARDREEAEEARDGAEEAREEAEGLAARAEEAEGEAVEAKEGAEDARDRAEAAAEQLEYPVCYGAEQQLTPAQRQTARGNIGAVGKEEKCPELTAGLALNLLDEHEQGTLQVFSLRTSRGTLSVKDRSTAEIKRVLGHTWVTDQLAENGDFALGTAGWACAPGQELTASQGTATLTADGENNAQLITREMSAPLRAGHRYLFSALLKCDAGEKSWGYFVAGDARNGRLTGEVAAAGAATLLPAGAWGRVMSLYTVPDTFTLPHRGLGLGHAAGPERLSENESVSFREVTVTDLTRAFGPGHEPDLSTVLTLLSPLYRAYSSGQMSHFTDAEVVSGGFNAFDRSTGKALLLEGREYQLTGACTTLTDRAGNLLAPDENGCFIPPVTGEASVAGADESTCVHLTWSGYRNGETEPFREDRLSLNCTAWFPGGMKSAGNRSDELTANRWIKRIGTVDLGTLPWSMEVGYDVPVFTAALPDARMPAPGERAAVCARYDSAPACLPAEMGEDDKVIRLNTQTPGINVTDSAFDSAEAFKASVQGVMCAYQLGEEESGTIDPPLRLLYRVSDFGTEKTESDTELPPLRAEIAYSADFPRVIATLPGEYQSQSSMDAFTLALGEYLGANVSKEWDEENRRYTYRFEEAE